MMQARLKMLSLRALPFADAASVGLPMGQLLRLSLFQVSVGMATVLLLGTLNRVMIVELSVPAMIVATMIALPVLIAPFRALLGFRSDTHRSAIGWKRVPYIWFGSLWQFGASRSCLSRFWCWAAMWSTRFLSPVRSLRRWPS